MASTETDLELFLGIGLVETTAKNALKNQKFCSALRDVINEAEATNGCPKQIGSLLYAVASKCPAKALAHRKTLATYIKQEKIKSNAQLEGALEYLRKLGDTSFSTEDFEIASGVGIEITEADVTASVLEVIDLEKDRLLTERYQVNMNQLIGKVAAALKFADGTTVRRIFEEKITNLLGPKTEADLVASSSKKKKTKGSKTSENQATKQVEEACSAAAEDPFAFFALPKDNHQVHTTVHFSNGTKMHISNSEEQLKQHLVSTGGKFVTRFPPEPNGYLHIGHAKAMFIDFGLAERYNGVCYLRFDDTNPEAEEVEFISHIQEIVSWLGWKPWKVTHSSEYFPQLHALAVQMIKSGHAYVCHQSSEEIKKFRQERQGSPWRDRPIEESLKLFDDMRRGLIEEGEATLRMKQDPKNENFNMFDLIAYRIKFTPHPHVGDQWCIYPSYDFTHCIVDSLENISHSLCTLEFEPRRASYYWLLEVLGLYKPVEFEYSRLNITYNVLSKRKLRALVEGGFVRGWDDPRLYTLSGLRRRGVSPEAINNFCKEMGITRSDSDIPVHRLEHHIRQDLDSNSPRTMAVLRPLKILITNMADDHQELVKGKMFPGRNEESYDLPFAKTLYIEETDFREQDEKGYYGLAPGKSVMLRYAYPITCDKAVKDESGRIIHLECQYDPEFHKSGEKPPKGVLNWIAQPLTGPMPIKIEARLYDLLFTVESPSTEADNGWLDKLNPQSEVVIQGALGNPNLRTCKVGDRFQFERMGYFCVDPDSTEELLVVNRTVTLRDSLSKLLRSLVPHGKFCTTTGDSKGDIDSGIEDIQQAVESGSEEVPQQTVPNTDFPVHSPILVKQSTNNARILRDQYLRNLLSKSGDQTQKDSDDEDGPITEEVETDPDTGFAELGGFRAELSTGLLTEEPMRLHPTRLFTPGQTYEPEELHPLGLTSSDARFGRKPRQPIRVYSEVVLKEKMNFKNLMLMNNYLSDGGLILPRRLTRLSKRVQKKLVKSVKLAQAMALLPVLDRRPEFKRRPRRIVE
eukprot:g1324.t1